MGDARAREVLALAEDVEATLGRMVADVACLHGSPGRTDARVAGCLRHPASMRDAMDRMDGSCDRIEASLGRIEDKPSLR